MTRSWRTLAKYHSSQLLKTQKTMKKTNEPSIKIQLKDLLPVQAGLQEVIALKKITDFQLNVLLAELFLSVSKACEAFETSKNAIAQKLAIKDEHGQMVRRVQENQVLIDFPSPAERIKFEKEIEVLANTSTTLPFEKLKRSSLNVEGMTASALIMLDPILIKD